MAATQTRWRASILYASTIHEITDEQADALARHLPGYGIAVLDGQRVRLDMTVEASTLGRATEEALKAARAAYAEAFDAVGQQVGIRIVTEEDEERELASPAPLDLVGIAEIAEMAGVTRQRAHQLSERPDFPQPVAEPRSGKVFTLGSVQRWLAGWERKTGRPRSA